MRQYRLVPMLSLLIGCFSCVLRTCVIHTLSPLACSSSAPTSLLFLLSAKTILQHGCHILFLGELLKVLNTHEIALGCCWRVVGNRNEILLFRKLALYFFRQNFQRYRIRKIRMLLCHQTGKLFLTSYFLLCQVGNLHGFCSHLSLPFSISFSGKIGHPPKTAALVSSSVSVSSLHSDIMLGVLAVKLCISPFQLQNLAGQVLK